MSMPAISTRSGRRLYLHNPSPSQILIDDIAHGLAHQCRFNGQTNKFYSVAQHSVIVSSILPPELKLAGLLHDAAEAYLGDIVQPLKELLPDFEAIESRFANVIGERFNVDLNHNTKVKKADLIALATERRDLMPMEIVEWESLVGIDPLRKVINPLSPEKAKAEFIDCYLKLTFKKDLNRSTKLNKSLFGSLLPRKFISL
jgi:5'-deoxynucleotidase YfbR-like HD superfamily hydrolase